VHVAAYTVIFMAYADVGTCLQRYTVLDSCRPGQCVITVVCGGVGFIYTWQVGNGVLSGGFI